MKSIVRLFNYLGHPGISGAWSVFTDSDIIDGVKDELESLYINNISITDYLKNENLDADKICVEQHTNSYKLKALLEKQKEGVIVRDDTITNTSDKTITINRAYSRFCIPGGEYEAYTQWNGSIKEAIGNWAPLNTTITAENLGVRSNSCATPMMALYSKQTNRGYAFYIFGNCMWKIEAHNLARTKLHYSTVELGVNEKGFAYKLQPGEILELPRIIVVPFTNKIDLDSYKLHKWFNRNYKRKQLPVIYNTWMGFFDKPNLQDVIKETEYASKLGVEYFVQDAGWFGHGTFWSNAVGDWEEKSDSNYNGRLIEIADAVRKNGMKFGLWVEMERARDDAPITSLKPDWFIKNGDIYFLDFGNESALDYAIEEITRLINKYGAEFIKLDFNADFSYDPTGNGFLKYHLGYKKYIEEIRRRFPNIYIEGCASGGYRMNMYNATLFDSFWISDNQSPYNEVRICKDTSKHMPVNCAEKWPAFIECDGFREYLKEGTQSKLIACHDSTWTNVIGVDESWLKAYTVGCPLGISFRLGDLSQKTRDMFKEIVDFYKENRDNYINAVSRILVDSEAYTIVQYTCDNGRSYINVFVWDEYANRIYIYPNTNGLNKDAKVIYSSCQYEGSLDDVIIIKHPLALRAETLIIE